MVHELDLKVLARKLLLGHSWIFWQVNDPKQARKVATKDNKDNKVNVMEWPSQSAELNPTEYLWAELKKFA